MSDEDKKYYLPPEFGTEVYRTQKDLVAIRQEDPLGQDDALVLISPERVDRLILMLRAVKDEILTDLADAAEARSTEHPHVSNG